MWFIITCFVLWRYLCKWRYVIDGNIIERATRVIMNINLAHKSADSDSHENQPLVYKLLETAWTKFCIHSSNFLWRELLDFFVDLGYKSIRTYQPYFYAICQLVLLHSDRPRDSRLHESLVSWWRHQMETFSVLLAVCAGNSSGHRWNPRTRPVKRSFDVFFDLRLYKRLIKHSWDRWFETPSRPLWRHCSVTGHLESGMHMYAYQ